MTFDKIITDGTKPEVLGDGYGFTEGPAADRDGNVYFSDGANNSIHRWQPGDRPDFRPGENGTVPLGSHGRITLFTDDSTDAVGMMFNAQGELYVCEGAAYRVVAFDVHTKAKRVLCSQIDGRHFNEPNDLAIDFHGGFYFSDPNYQHRGQPTVMKQDVYYCSAQGRVTRVSTISFKPNGVRLSADDRTLYVADARGQRIYRYDVVGPGQLAGERLWIDQLTANPDGMTLDEHDNLYICCGKAGLKIFDRGANPIGRIDVHAANCTFGAPDFRTLCIASADKFLGIRTNVTGMKPLVLRIPKKPA
jgi:gluconolactonase